MKIFTSKTQKVGQIGEDKACSYLKKKGFRIIERNIANKYGEIDIVAQKDKVIYFFEVKSGKENSFINPAENLSPLKIKKFYRSVDYYCFKNKISFFRAQAIVVTLKENSECEIEIFDLG